MGTDEIIAELESYLDNDGYADYITMIEGLGLVGGIAGIIVGLLVVLIIIAVPIVSAIELLYLNIPAIQDTFENISNKLTGKRQNLLGLVLRDARLAVKLSKTSEIGHSIGYIYLRLKLKTIILSVLIVAMVLGPGQFLLSLASDLVSDIVSTIF